MLDRPNPITGSHVEGPPDLRLRNFAGYYAIPIRHGLTVGEVARLINVEIGCHLEVVPVQGWRCSVWWTKPAWSG